MRVALRTIIPIQIGNASVCHAALPGLLPGPSTAAQGFCACSSCMGLRLPVISATAARRIAAAAPGCDQPRLWPTSCQQMVGLYDRLNPPLKLANETPAVRAAGVGRYASSASAVCVAKGHIVRARQCKWAGGSHRIAGTRASRRGEVAAESNMAYSFYSKRRLR